MTPVSPRAFFALLTWLDGRPLLDVLMPYQLAQIDAVFWTFTPDGAPRYLRALWSRAKKNAKTGTGVLSSLWALLCWQAVGARGNQVYYVASDQGQANDDLDLCKKLIRCNPVIAHEVTIKTNIVQRRDGDGFIEILPAGDVEGLHGKTYRLLVVDEFHTQRDYRVLEALELDRTRRDAQQLFLSYASPYRHAGVPLVDVLKQHAAGTDPRLYVANHAGTVEEANPSLNGPLGPTLADIEQARRSLPSWVFRRLYLNLPGAPDGAAFDASVLEDATAPGRTVLPPQPGVSYVAFADMSGGGADDSTLAIAHGDADRAVLDLVMDQGPRDGTFDPTAAVTKFAALLRQYRITRVVGDRYAGEWPKRAFEAEGVAYVMTDYTKSDLYAAVEPVLNAGRVVLLDLPKLLAQWIGLVRKGAKIDHASGEHDDWSNAAAGAIVHTLANGAPMTEAEFDAAVILGPPREATAQLARDRAAEQHARDFWADRGFYEPEGMDRWDWP